MCVASSTGGKSDSIQNLILKIYRRSFEIIYILLALGIRCMTHGGQSRKTLLIQ